MKKLNFSAFKFDLTLDDRYPLFWKHLFYSAEILAKTNSRLLFCLALVWVLFFSLSNCFVFHTAEIFRHGRSHILFSVVAHHSTFLSKLIRSTTKIHTRKMSSNESVKRKRGAFLLFEGVDRCGKTTQSKLLTEHLNRINGEDSCIPMRFPDRTTTIGKIIDSYLTSKTDLNDHSIHLLFSANRWERKQYIEESLRNGQSIVSLEKELYFNVFLIPFHTGLWSIRLQWSRFYLCQGARSFLVSNLWSRTSSTWCDYLSRYFAGRSSNGILFYFILLYFIFIFFFLLNCSP